MASHVLPGLVLGMIALQAIDDQDPGQLVPQLGAARYADREAAGEALAKIGREALPALVKAAKDGDPEVRRRAEALVARIEAGQLLDATRVSLDIRDRPLAEAAETIAKASGMTLKPTANARNLRLEPTWPVRRVTLQAPAPVPFWEVIDRLCLAAGLQREAGYNFFPFKSPFVLTLVPGKAQPPACDTGALRVELLRVRYRRERNYGNRDDDFSLFEGPTASKRDAETGAIERSSYTAELLISAEPRLRIFGVGEIEKTQVVDDRGRSLVRTPTAEEKARQLALTQMNPHLDPRLNPGLRYGSGSHTSVKTWPISIPLSYPSPPARRISLLGGVIPVVVVARRPDPLEVALKDASGKEFSAGSTRITVHEITADSGREPTVDFSVETAQAGDEETIAVCDPKGARMAVSRPVDLVQLRLEVLDNRGESLFWQFTRPPTVRTQGRMVIVIHDRNQKRERPDNLRLRYWSVIAAATDLPFLFKDVPTP